MSLISFNLVLEWARSTVRRRAVATAASSRGRWRAASSSQARREAGHPLTGRPQPGRGPVNILRLHWPAPAAEPSDHRHPAVDVERVPGDVGGFGRGEKYGRGRDFVGRAEPPRRYRRENGLMLFLAQHRRHRGADEPRRDTVDGDIARGDLVRERLGHADHAGLGGRVIALPGISGDADDRGDPDDAPEPAPHHAARCRAREAKAGGEIDGNDLIPILVLETDE